MKPKFIKKQTKAKGKARSNLKAHRKQVIPKRASEVENESSDESVVEVQNQSLSASSNGYLQKNKVEKIEKDAKKRKANLPPINKTVPNGTTGAVKKPKGEEKVKPPTLEEINELKETRNLFHSNLLRLQLKEMLAEIKIKEKYINYINNWLDKFKIFVRELVSNTEKSESDKLKWLQQSAMQVPLNLDQLHVQNQKPFQFQFIKPNQDPYLIGAAATSTLLGPKLFVDICVTMPAAYFEKDNYLNLIYDKKRAFYLTYIGNEMLSSKHFDGMNLSNLKFNYFSNNPLKPMLEVTPLSSAGGIANKLCFRVFAAAEEGSFKLNRFVPWNNNIRASIFSEDDPEALHLATPNYNAGVLFDLTMQSNQRLLREVFETHKNFQEGLLLLKVWLHQRQLNVGYSGFHSHLLAMLIAYLFKQRRMHVNMSSYQVARTVWNCLAVSTWDEVGITLCPQENVNPTQPTLEQFHASFSVVFIDFTGFHNLCANLALETYRRVRTESKLAVDTLNDMKLNSFQLLFMTKCPLYRQFDHILKINKSDAIEQILQLHVPPADKLNYSGYVYPQLLKVVTNLLQKGLGQRVRALMPIEQLTQSWSVLERAPVCSEYLHLGIVLNPEYAFEILDKGPESIAVDAEEFRSFWGDKAQLRRFQDGSITESVVWASISDTLAKKRLIVRSIILHLLQQHLQLEPDEVDYIAGEFDVVYQLTPAFKTDKLPEKFKVPQDTDAEAMSVLVIRCFDDLSRKLHALHDLPLEIVSIAGISPVFRYCDPTPILPLARCINEQFVAPSVQHGVIQLGLSGKWPGELVALRALKTAFYIKIAKLLREKHHLLCKVTYDGVLIIKQGYCFAIEIAHPKEVALLKKEKNERGITQYVDSEDSRRLEKQHYVLPRITGALHALYQVHPSFGGTVMIAKRWLYSQLIDNGLWLDECTELLIASQYVNGGCQQHVCSPQTGFIRFLQLLAHTNWRTEMFLLNFNNTLDENEVTEIEQRFNEQRDTYPPLYIATAYDQKHYGLLWTTREQPSVHILARVTILAREALSIVGDALLSTSKFIKPSKLFTASSEGYDLVIQLKPDMVPSSLALEFGSPFVPFARPNWRLPLAGTNFLMEAVEKLREAYSAFAVFFYNPCGGKEIGVIWRPDIDIEKEFKVTDVNGCALSANGEKLQCKKDVLIEDFKFILKDFYLRIDTAEALQSAASAHCDATNRTVRYFEKSQDFDEVVINPVRAIKPIKSTPPIAEKQNTIVTKKTAKQSKTKKGKFKKFAKKHVKPFIAAKKTKLKN